MVVQDQAKKEHRHYFKMLVVECFKSHRDNESIQNERKAEKNGIPTNSLNMNF